MGNFNNKLQNYQSIPRQLIFNNQLSDRARFVFCYMASKPDGWDFYIEPMANELGYTSKTLRKYINELIDSGWLVKGEQKNEGKFGAVEYTLMDESREILPCGKKFATQKSRDAKSSPLINIDNIENKDNIKNKDNILERFGIKEEELNVSSQTIKKIASKFEKLEFPYDDKEFLKLFFTLCTTKKWRAKEVNTLQMQLKKISAFEVGFSKLLIEESIANEWQGLVYENTDDKYRKWKGGNKLNIVNFNNEKTYEEF